MVGDGAPPLDANELGLVGEEDAGDDVDESAVPAEERSDGGGERYAAAAAGADDGDTGDAGVGGSPIPKCRSA